MTNRRYTPAVLAALAVRLTHRDRHILRMVWEHRVLTAPQITELAFPSGDTARKRLLQLHGMGVLDRFAPSLPVGAGTAPYHYVIGEAGAAVLAAEDGIDFAAFGYRRDRVLAIAYSQNLTHTVGVNGFFTALTAHARTATNAELVAWWSEHRCTTVWGNTTRPDAYGHWSEDGAAVDFFLEYDTGTETLDKVAHKLHGYAALARSTGITTPLLFWTHSEEREANLRTRLNAHPASPAMPIATASRSPISAPTADGPAGPIWLPLHSRSLRVRLAELRSAWPHPGACGNRSPDNDGSHERGDSL